MGIDSSSKDVLYALVVLLMAALALVFSQGLRALKGTAELVRRARKSGESDEDWLLGPAIRPGCTQNLPGLRIQLAFSAAAVKQWQADEPPPLATDGPSHLWGWIPRSLCPDIVIRPEPTHICAAPVDVWKALLDFDSYAEWNPFHRKVEVRVEICSSSVI